MRYMDMCIRRETNVIQQANSCKGVKERVLLGVNICEMNQWLNDLHIF